MCGWGNPDAAGEDKVMVAMNSVNSETVLCPDGVWVISDGRYRDLDLRLILEGAKVITVKEYRISDLAYYMLNPKTIEVKKKLIGCEVYDAEPFSNRFKAGIKRFLPRFMHGMFQETCVQPALLLCGQDASTPVLEDQRLEAHFENLHLNLRPYNPVLKSLSRIDPQKTADIVGVCEDTGGNRSQLLIKGDIEEKTAYMSNWISQEVGVTLDRAYVAKGLFEMGGFDWDSYNNQSSYRLITFLHNGDPRSMVLDSENRVKFEVKDQSLVRYMQLLENCLRVNPKMKDALNQCAQGKARAAKILFNRQMEIGYSSTRIPEIYRQAFEACDIGVNEIDAVMSKLNTKQFGIAFSYIPRCDDGSGRVFTTISVMHDFRALDEIKSELPELYSEISKRASVSDAGTYYLLDAIRGYNNG